MQNTSGKYPLNADDVRSAFERIHSKAIGWKPRPEAEVRKQKRKAWRAWRTPVWTQRDPFASMRPVETLVGYCLDNNISVDDFFR